MADLAGTISTAAGGPQSVTADGLSVNQQDLAKLAGADRYLAAKAARKTRRRGLLFSKVLVSGAVPDSQGTGIGGVNFASAGGVW